MIEVGDETAVTMYNFPVDMNESERILFFEYARTHITEEQFETIMIEWALVHILETEANRVLALNELEKTNGRTEE